ncbi:MAG: stage II sporulation protein M [Aeoliella sp.]
MKAAELVESRLKQWRQLEQCCLGMERRGKGRLDAKRRTEFAALYRAACADLALADAYQLPAGTVRYLHQLVGRAHNQLYRSGKFDYGQWYEEMFKNVPQRLFHDGYLRVAFVIFWGGFLLSGFLASKWTPVPAYAESVVTDEGLLHMEMSFSEPIGSSGASGFESGMMGFYVFNNTSIGLRCFAMGLVFGVGGLFATLFNAVYLGACFGYMTTVPEGENFFVFVTAHGPFELTAIVLSAAAGMRLGFSIVSTDGLSRGASLARAARQSLPTMLAAVVLFFLAAVIEGFLSPSAAPYEIKAAVAMVSTLLLLIYLVVLGYSERPPDDVAPTDASFDLAN